MPPGAAMMAAVAIGAYPSMDACIAEWVTPLLGPAEAPDPELVRVYDRLFPAYAQARGALVPVWDALAARGDADENDGCSPCHEGARKEHDMTRTRNDRPAGDRRRHQRCGDRARRRRARPVA